MAKKKGTPSEIPAPGEYPEIEPDIPNEPVPGKDPEIDPEPDRKPEPVKEPEKPQKPEIDEP